MLAITFAASCSDSDNATDGKRTFDDKDAPQVVSVTPAADAVDVDTIDSVVVTYNEPIYRTPVASIKINNSYYVDSGVVVRGNQLIIPLKTQGNRTYSIKIMKPTVRDSSYNFASEYVTSFSTKLYNNFDSTQFNIADALVNPNATESTVKLYKYLKSMFGKKIISAAVTANNWNTLNADTIYQYSGKYPAINTFDFIHFIYSKPLHPSNWIDYTNLTPVTNWADNGGIVSCMWHWLVPDAQVDTLNYSKYTYKSDETDFTAKNATRTNRWEYKHALRDIDIIAGYLLSLQEKGISVIWRPLHEAAGNTNRYTDGKAWFWWGTSGPTQFKKLWMMMFNRFKEKGVNNLIWVWTSEGNDAEWYPGDEYVDMIARDYYENDATLFHSSIKAEFDKLVAITGGKKLVTLGECGAIPSFSNMVDNGDMWSWFMPWSGGYMHEPYNSVSFFNTQMNSDYVITRDEVPNLK